MEVAEPEGLYIHVQQSAVEAQLLPDDEKSARQLSLPHLRLPAQWESRSQSPPPSLHGLEVEQQLQPVDGTPLHALGDGVVDAVPVGVVVFGVPNAN